MQKPSQVLQAKKSWHTISQQMSTIMTPCRPSEEDSLHYGQLMAQALRGVKHPRIMVMGSTPEIRRLTYTYASMRRGEAHCVDLSRDMYEAMSLMMHPEVRESERFHERSWVSTGLPKNYFDLVVGDEVIYNVLPLEQPRLIREISRILRRNGWWITKHNIFPTRVHVMNPRQMLLNVAKRIDRGEISFQRGYNDLAVLVHYHVMKQSPDHGYRGKDSIPPLHEAFKRYCQHARYRSIILKLLSLYEKHFVSSLGTHVWSALPEKQSDDELKEYFRIVGKVCAHDYVSTSLSPIYVMRKR